jgi:hypothetical protein
VPDSALTATPSAYDFPLAVPYVLAANSRYWIELSSNTASTANWDFSTDVSGPGVATEFFFFGGTAYPNAGAPYQMQVNADAILNPVPEPSGLMVFAIGLSGLSFVLWRSRP